MSKLKQITCTPSEDSDQPGRIPGQDAEADLSLRWVHSHFAGLSLGGSFIAAEEYQRTFSSSLRFIEFYFSVLETTIPA